MEKKNFQITAIFQLYTYTHTHVVHVLIMHELRVSNAATVRSSAAALIII